LRRHYIRRLLPAWARPRCLGLYR